MRKSLLVIFALFSFLLVNSGIANAQFPTINLDFLSGILIQYIGIVFILVFIVIFLFIGGVIHLPSSGGGSIVVLIIFAILLVLAFSFPQFITFPDYVKEVPASFKYWPLPGPAADGLQLIGLPREWAYVPAILYLFVLPFAAIYTLFWAFLTTLQIFPSQRGVNRILALIVAFITIPVGWFTKMVWALFAFMGGWSVAVFAVMFIAGIFFRGAGIVGKQYADYRKMASLRQARLKEAIKELEAIKGDRGTIQSEAGAIAHKYQDVFSAEAFQKISRAASDADPGELQAAIDAAKRGLS